MFRTTLFALAAAAVAVAMVASAQAKSTGLTAEVGPGFKIEVEKAGKDLKTIKAGTYRIKVEDPSTIHNFRLKGLGVNKATSVVGKTERVWTVTLKKGIYKFVCDPHATTMRGTVRVT